MSVTVVRTTLPARAGSIFILLITSGNNTPAVAAATRLITMAAAITRPIFTLPNQNSAHCDHKRPAKAVERPDDYFLSLTIACCWTDLAQRDAPDHQRQGLGACDAAHAGDHIH